MTHGRAVVPGRGQMSAKGPVTDSPLLGNEARIAAVEWKLVQRGLPTPPPSVRLAGPGPETRRLAGIQIGLSEAERNGGGARVES